LDDAQSLSEAANNPKIAQFMRNTFPYPYTIDDARKWISMTTSASPAYDFIICLPDNATVIGSIGLKPKTDIEYRTMEIGYWIREEQWGQGIATEALLAFSAWTFETFKHLLRLEAEVFAGNMASGRVLEKAGFEYEARRKWAIEKAGVVMDLMIYCKFRSAS
jgi:RimJ/RimL family protein N-acetyltransferase